MTKVGTFHDSSCIKIHSGVDQFRGHGQAAEAPGQKLSVAAEVMWTSAW
jgi:hypothetical protein